MMPSGITLLLYMAGFSLWELSAAVTGSVLQGVFCTAVPLGALLGINAVKTCRLHRDILLFANKKEKCKRISLFLYVG